MRYCRVILCVTLCLLCWATASQATDEYMTVDKAAFFTRMQQMLFNDQFAEVDTAVTRYMLANPSDPAGYLFLAGSLMAQMTDREEQIQPDRFKALLDTAVALTNGYYTIGSDRTRAWMHLIRGHAHAYRSLYASRFGAFTTAIDKGFDAKGEYQRGLTHDSTLYDLYFGLGSYHYWKSARAGVLRWIGIFKNDKKKGIRELRLAADSSAISREVASNALIWVYFDHGQFDSASTIVHQALQQYPQGKSFLWPLAQAQFKQKQYTDALATYSELRLRLEHQPGNYFNLVECDYYRTRCYEKLQQDDAATQSAGKLAEYYGDLSQQVVKRKQNSLAYLKKVAERSETTTVDASLGF